MEVEKKWEGVEEEQEPPILMEMGTRGRSQLKLSLLLEKHTKLLIFAVYREPVLLV